MFHSLTLRVNLSTISLSTLCHLSLPLSLPKPYTKYPSSFSCSSFYIWSYDLTLSLSLILTLSFSLNISTSICPFYISYSTSTSLASVSPISIYLNLLINIVILIYVNPSLFLLFSQFTFISYLSTPHSFLFISLILSDPYSLNVLIPYSLIFSYF